MKKKGQQNKLLQFDGIITNKQQKYIYYLKSF
jgi:hypothetical protein